MPTKPSPAQVAVRITWKLKGQLKSERIIYLRVGATLAQIRDQRLFAALKHDSMESYAKERLRLGRAAYYRYMQVHDWVRDFHPAWLRKKPQGFIPELTDAFALMWIERKLAAGGLTEVKRRELEKFRKKALAGELTDDEFEKLRSGARQETTPLAALLSGLRAAERRAKKVPALPVAVLAEIRALIARVAALTEATKRLASIASRSRSRTIVLV